MTDFNGTHQRSNFGRCCQIMAFFKAKKEACAIGIAATSWVSNLGNGNGRDFRFAFLLIDHGAFGTQGNNEGLYPFGDRLDA